MTLRARWKRAGIVLVTTLLLMVLVVMIVTVVVFTGAGGLSLTGNFYEREAALLAADSGLQYAMARMQADPNWRGNSNDTVPTARPDFSVMERDGNVYGFLSTVYGHKSQFRIKFNYEDGAGGQDSLEDTSDANLILRSGLVSINNLLGTGAVPASRSNPDGVGVSPNPAPYTIPRATACIIVEGLAGWGVRSASVDNPQDVLAGRAVTRRVVEAYFALDNSDSADSAAYAAGAVDANLPDGGKFNVSSSDDDVNPRIRTLQGMSVDPQASGTVSYNSTNGEVVVGEGSNFTVNSTTPSDITVTEADSSSLFKKITWDSISKASATSTSDAQMKGGTYVWRLDDQDQPYLEYFDQEYEAGDALPQAGSGTRIDSSNVTSQGSGVAVDSTGLSITLSNNVYVNTSNGGASGLAILTDPAVTQAGFRPIVGFQPPEGSEKAPILTSAGSIRMEGSVLGRGAVTSEGGITFQGPSILESDPETGVSLYAKGDITLEAIPEAVADARGDMVSGVEQAIADGETLPPTGYVTEGTGGPPGHGPSGPPGNGNGPPIVPPGLVNNANAFMEKKTEQLTRYYEKFGNIDYADQNVTGVIYTWKNFNANLGDRGVLTVTGTVIAYGGDPSSTTNSSPGSYENQGRIDITARGVDLVYDSSYLKDLLSNAGPVKVKRSLWATY